MIRRRTLSLCLLLLTATSCATTRPPDPLKVTRVVLYQNGVGYFERRGKVKGDRVTLRIRRQQITDILKSLTVVDLRQGRAINVALPVEKTQARRLAALPRQVRRGGGLAALARAFRGARATVRARSGSATGRIVGIEQTSGEKPSTRITLLQDDGTLRAFDLAKVRSMKIKDRTLEVGLRQALDVALDQGAWKPVELTVHLAGSRAHDLLISYVVDMPTWKPAYRVVLDTAEGNNALLQGWAVVDNVSGEDWNRVKLSLTAGTPLTFRYDLYTPRYVHRPDLSPRQEAQAVAPPPPTDGAMGDQEAPAELDEAKAAEPAKKTKRRRSRRGPVPATTLPPPAPKPDQEPQPEITGKLLEKSFRTLVGGSRVGSLFRYDIGKPVTIRDRQSALVSIINQRVPGGDVLLYRIETSRDHPYRAVRLKNNTGFVLEKGPVAIYRDGTFVGEAVSGRIEADSSSFVPYAIDGRVLIKLDEKVQDRDVELIRINRGWIACEYKRVTLFKYTVHNRSNKAATLYVQRRHRTGWKLTRAEGTLVEKEHYFVPVALAKDGKTELEVREEQPVRQSVALSSYYGRQAISLYLKNADVTKTPAGAKLKQVYDLHQKVAQLEDELAQLRRSREAYANRQEEVRKNIKLLGKTRGNADLKRQLVANLTELEKKLSLVTRDLVAKDIRRNELRRRMSVLFKTITLTVK